MPTTYNSQVFLYDVVLADGTRMVYYANWYEISKAGVLEIGTSDKHGNDDTTIWFGPTGWLSMTASKRDAE